MAEDPLTMGSSQPRTSTLAVLRVPAFRRVLASTTTAALGGHLQAVAAAWVMVEVTGSGSMAAFVVAMVAGSAFLLGLPAGALADRVDRRRLLAAAFGMNVVVALALFGLSLGGLLGVVPLLLLSGVQGAAAALASPAALALVPDILPDGRLSDGIALQGASESAARVVGPLLAGALVAAGATPLAFLVNGFAQSTVILAVRSVPAPRIIDDAAIQRLWPSVRSGLRFLRYSPSLLGGTIALASLAFAFGGFQGLLPGVALGLGRGPGGYGLLAAAGGCGAMAGALMLRRLGDRVGQGRLIRLCWAGHGGAALGMGVVPGVIPGIVPGIVPGLVCSAAAGLCWMIAANILVANCQISAPSWVRGRTSSIVLLALSGGVTLGAFAAGFLGSVVGPSRAITLSGALTIVGVVALRRLSLVAPGLVKPWQATVEEARRSSQEPVEGPAVVLVRWRVAQAHRDELVAALEVLSRHRLRAGARNWRLLDAVVAGEIVESFEVRDWASYARQLGYFDPLAQRAAERALDLHGGHPIVQPLAILRTAGRPAAAAGPGRRVRTSAVAALRVQDPRHEGRDEGGALGDHSPAGR